MRETEPFLVAIVRHAEEVEDALRGGADVIAAEAEDFAAIRTAVEGRAEIMAFARLPATEPAASEADWIAAPVRTAPPTAGRRRFAVIAAEEPEPAIDGLKTVGFTDVLLDLGPGEGGVSRIGLPKLRRLSDAIRMADLGLAFGGALEAPDVPRLRVLRPDALVFDRALCREGRLDRAATQAIAALLRPDALASDGPTDRIFVRDLVTEMEVGAYGHERGRRQRVRFNIEVEVPRAGASAGMGGVYSYDLITDAVAMLAASAHVDFVESLAEDLAAAVLADPRVRCVIVRVEKLDLGPGSVGIEIRRTR